MLKGVGTDIIEISRIKRAIEKKSFLERVYTLSEIDYIKHKGAKSAAGYFCVKEAVSKALGTGISGFSFRDIEVVKKGETPQVVLHNGAEEAAKKIGIKNIKISISHSREYAVAVAVAEG